MLVVVQVSTSNSVTYLHSDRHAVNLAHSDKDSIHHHHHLGHCYRQCHCQRHRNHHDVGIVIGDGIAIGHGHGQCVGIVHGLVNIDTDGQCNGLDESECYINRQSIAVRHTIR